MSRMGPTTLSHLIFVEVKSGLAQHPQAGVLALPGYPEPALPKSTLQLKEKRGHGVTCNIAVTST